MSTQVMHHGLERSADRFRDRVFLRFGDEHLTFADVDARSNAFARYLSAQGIGTDDRVAVMLGNRPDFVVAVLGISKGGAAAVLVSPAWKAREVDHAIGLTRPVHAVVEGTTAA